MPGIREVLTCRTVAEAHLYLDLRGFERQGREHRLEAHGDDLVSVYTCTRDGEESVFAFLSPDDPLEWTGFGGPSPSEIIDAAQFLQHASKLARSVNPDPKALDAYGRKSAAATLERAAQCIDEVIKFIPAGEEQITGAAFWSDESRALRDKEPGRFRRSRLEAVAKAYRTMAERFGAGS